MRYCHFLNFLKGEDIRADWKLVFSFVLFSYKKKERENFFFFAGPRLATILAYRWTGNRLFLRVASVLYSRNKAPISYVFSAAYKVTRPGHGGKVSPEVSGSACG